MMGNLGKSEVLHSGAHQLENDIFTGIPVNKKWHPDTPGGTCLFGCSCPADRQFTSSGDCKIIAGHSGSVAACPGEWAFIFHRPEIGKEVISLSISCYSRVWNKPLKVWKGKGKKCKWEKCIGRDTDTNVQLEDSLRLDVMENVCVYVKMGECGPRWDACSPPHKASNKLG